MLSWSDVFRPRDHRVSVRQKHQDTHSTKIMTTRLGNKEIYNEKLQRRNLTLTQPARRAKETTASPSQQITARLNVVNRFRPVNKPKSPSQTQAPHSLCRWLLPPLVLCPCLLCFLFPWWFGLESKNKWDLTTHLFL